MKRRSLLMSPLAGAALGLSPAVYAWEKTTHWDDECTVLCFGSGIAGLCAAISAKENGAAKVLLFEKGAFLGGHTLMSGSGFCVGGTEIQKKAGIDDSPEINWKDSVERGIKANKFIKGNTKPVKRVYEEGPQTLEWLQGLGVKFVDQPVQSMGNRKRTHYFYPGYKVGSPVLIKTLSEKAVEVGVKIQKNAKLVSLITEGPEIGSRVIGAVVEMQGGKRINVKATGGVVLATGGFANNRELIKRYHPYLLEIPTFGSKLNTGDGIVAAQELGANLILETNGLGVNILFIGTHKGQSMGMPLMSTPVIVVNKKGLRVNDESKGYTGVVKQLIYDGDSLADWIFDKKVYDEFRNSQLKQLFDTEVVKSYPTIEALAKGEHIDAEGLKKTIAEYNEDVDKGKDRKFNRTVLLQKINEPPFYAFEAGPRYYTTYSGLEINEEGQVIDTRGKPIPGLYAAGDITGLMPIQTNLGQAGVSGLNIGATYGRITGKNAAKGL